MNDQDDYRKYRNLLPVMKHRLDDELELHAQVYETISSKVVVLNSRMLEAKNRLASVEDRLAEGFREDHEKLTKDAIEGKVRRHRDRTEAWEAYQRARADHEQWSGLLDAWKQKGYSIKTLAELYTADYYSITTTSVGGGMPNYDREQGRRVTPGSAVRDDAYTERRASIRRASTQSEAEPPKSEESRPRRRSLINE